MKAASISTYIFALDSIWWRCSVDVWRLKKKNLQHGKNNTLLLLKEMIEKWYLITTKILELNTINIKGEMQFRKKKPTNFIRALFLQIVLPTSELFPPFLFFFHLLWLLGFAVTFCPFSISCSLSSSSFLKHFYSWDTLLRKL